MKIRRHALILGSCIFSSLFASGCASGARYVWVEELPQKQGDEAFVVAPGDLLAVRVLNQDNLSTNGRVRSDGKVAVPLLGDVEVGGRAPAAISKELEGRFKQFVVAPSVTITVEESQSTTISVLGEVGHPGVYTVAPNSGVLQGLAIAGGFTDYASHDSIFVVRPAQPARIRFSYDNLQQGSGPAATFRLHSGDVLVVE